MSGSVGRLGILGLKLGEWGLDLVVWVCVGFHRDLGWMVLMVARIYGIRRGEIGRGSWVGLRWIRGLMLQGIFFFNGTW